MTTTTTEPRAWVGCLACYNAGTLRGEWVDAIEAADYVPCEGRGHEEWWVMDHEGFGSALSGECSPMYAQEMAEALEQIEDYQKDAFEAYLANENPSSTWTVRDIIEAFSRQYRGAVEVSTTYNGYSRDVCALAEYLEDLFPEDELPGWARGAWWSVVLYNAQAESDSGTFTVLDLGGGEFAIFDNRA